MAVSTRERERMIDLRLTETEVMVVEACIKTRIAGFEAVGGRPTSHRELLTKVRDARAGKRA